MVLYVTEHCPINIGNVDLNPLGSTSVPLFRLYMGFIRVRKTNLKL